ncbi:GPW/gp25 family protein [Geodermatophilus sp. SYSU D01105]
MYVDFPWSYDGRGRTAETTRADHVRDLLVLTALTEAGERVNRPGFGCGLRQLVFAPNSAELAAALQFTMQGAIERELGDVLTLRALQVTSEDSILDVTVTYVLRETGAEETVTVRREAGP